jgi:hypothetical protein
MPSTKRISRAHAALQVITAIACDLPRHGADHIAMTLEPDASSVRLSAVVRGDIAKALAVAEELREAAALRGHRLLGGAGFDLARTDLTPDQQRLSFLCPVA